MRMPLILLNITTLGVSIYAAMGKVPGFFISWGASSIIGAILLLYLIGSFMISSDKKEEDQVIDQEEVSEEEPKGF